MKDRVALFLATGCCLGYIPFAPGTWGSLATTLVFWLVYRVSFRIVPSLHLSTICLISLIGVLSSTAVARQVGREDPGIVVIDEIAGQLLTFLLVPVSWVSLLAGTVLFRLFDILKPYPIRKLESLREGIGIMADDLLAGVFANVVLQAWFRLVW